VFIDKVADVLEKCYLGTYVLRHKIIFVQTSLQADMYFCIYVGRKFDGWTQTSQREI
jgi:hypothetical protein